MLKNKVIVITGGAGLIGREFVKTIIENNGIAILADIDKLKGIQIKQTIMMSHETDRIDYIELDITSKDSLNKCINCLNEKYGRIDAIVNNAYPRNKNYGNDFFDVEYDDFCDNVNLNLGGYFLASKLFAQYFKLQGYGNIINIGSIYGVVAPKFDIYHGTRMTTPIEYAAIKSAILHLTKYMAKYFKGMNIRVNAISPGGIFNDQAEEFVHNYTKQCLNKGMLDSQDLTGTLLYLLSDMSQYVNGQNIIVDDGFVL